MDPLILPGNISEIKVYRVRTKKGKLELKYVQKKKKETKHWAKRKKIFKNLHMDYG